MQKILELKGEDWSKTLSVQTGLALGGLFQSYTGADPFERVGFLQPSLSATELTTPSTDAVKVITPLNISSTSVVLAHSNSKLYKYLTTSPYTQTDLTASINVSANVAGALYWKGKYVYAQPTSLRSWDLSSTDVEILSGSYSSSLDVRHLCIGADKNLYTTDYGSISKCVINTGTSGNALDSFLIDSNHTGRSQINDGRFLVIFADDNTVATSTRTVGTFSCRAYFWDMVKSTADVIWDFPGESYLIGAGILDGTILVFGYNGIWVCNAFTQPKMIASFLGNSTLVGRRPTTPYQIVSTPNAVYWADGSANGQFIYAYGHIPGSSKNYFYTPYQTHSSSYAHTSLASTAGTLFTGVDAPKLYAHNVGSTRGNATVQTAPVSLGQPFRYGYGKVVLREPLTTGQGIDLRAYTASGTVISGTNSKTYSSVGAKKTFTFPLKAESGSTSVMEDISILINPQAGAAVERVAIYAEPVQDANQTI